MLPNATASRETPLKTVRPQADLRGCVFKYVLLLGVAACVATYLFVLQPELAETEENLGAIASQIAQRPVAVECQGIISQAIDVTNSEGRVEYTEGGAPSDKTQLKRDVCKRLGGFQATRGAGRYACLVSELECTDDVLKTVRAVHTLSHEAWHLAGVKDERIAECYAMQTDQLVATSVGASKRLGRAIAVHYATDIYPHLSTKYRSSSCKGGGPYDFSRGSRTWP